jgi:hypothetical protein
MTMTGDEALSMARRLVGSIESAMMQTAPGELIELWALRLEREAAMELLKRTERRALTLRRTARESWAGTRLHARWPQASFGG